ncbi:MAG: PDZ domain-containing protein [Planctomycetota bacterium]
MRISIRQWKSLVWLLNLLALVGVAFTFYMIVQKKEQKVFTARGRDYWQGLITPKRDSSARAQKPESGRPDRRFFDVIARLAVTGEAPVAPTVTETVEEVKPAATVPEITEKIFVSVIMYPLSAALRYVDYPAWQGLDSERKLREVFVSVGSLLASPYDVEPYNASVLAIEPGKVKFSWGGQEAEVPVSFQKLAPVPGASRGEPSSPSDYSRFWAKEEPPEQTLSLENDTVIVLSGADQDKFADNYRDMLDNDVRVSSKKNPHTQKQELRIEYVRSDGAAAQLGFRQGDTVISVNGYAISSSTQAINWLKSHPNEPAYTVKYTRQGKEMTRTFIAPRRR